MFSSFEVSLNLIPNTLSNTPIKPHLHFPSGNNPMGNDIPTVKRGGVRRWAVKIHTDKGVPIERIIRLKDIKKEFDDARKRGLKRATMPLLPWVIDFIIHNHNLKFGPIESFTVKPYRRP